MISPESLINDLQKRIAQLETELAQAQKDIKDFEVLAVEWKKGYDELRSKNLIRLKEKDQVISELEDEIEELKAIEDLRDWKD
jgi:uncharacterized protein (UPF0335 family)